MPLWPWLGDPSFPKRTAPGSTCAARGGSSGSPGPALGRRSRPHGWRAGGGTRAAQAVLDHDPYDEAALRLVMRADALAQRPGAALAAYATVRHRLSEDLGADPAPGPNSCTPQSFGASSPSCSRPDRDTPPWSAVTPRRVFSTGCMRRHSRRRVSRSEPSSKPKPAWARAPLVATWTTQVSSHAGHRRPLRPAWRWPAAGTPHRRVGRPSGRPGTPNGDRAARPRGVGVGAPPRRSTHRAARRRDHDHRRRDRPSGPIRCARRGAA